ncbi:MAG: helix-hairpin-helix domain-containing protein [Deltaproteobacteria bacterium]|nr:helix-hairpin-helix domain-containing protein [Deltaproteobacteria bacterium]
MGTRQEIGLFVLASLLLLAAALSRAGGGRAEPERGCQRWARVAALGERPVLVCLDRRAAILQSCGELPGSGWPLELEIERDEAGGCRLASRPMAADARLLVGLRIDLNTAAAGELELVPGIGPVLAERIAGLREQRGRFERVDELTEVRGIGPRILERIGPYLCTGR